jgi:hypothetical protein
MTDGGPFVTPELPMGVAWRLFGEAMGPVPGILFSTNSFISRIVEFGTWILEMG